jgi:hypothetical protein
MDRDRLKQVQQTDLTESRVNEDFVLWLKTRGPSWLLAVLIVLCVFVVVDRWRQSKARHQDSAWIELTGAQSPPAYLEVADSYTDVGSVSVLARIGAADTYLGSVRLGTRFDRTETDDDFQLTDEKRTEYLDEAGRLYGEVLERARSNPDQRLFAVAAAFGLAAVAESRGDLDGALGHLEQAAEFAGDDYVFLAGQARKRLETIDSLAVGRELPRAEDLPERSTQPQETVPTIQPFLQELWTDAFADA